MLLLFKSFSDMKNHTLSITFINRCQSYPSQCIVYTKFDCGGHLGSHFVSSSNICIVSYHYKQMQNDKINQFRLQSEERYEDFSFFGSHIGGHLGFEGLNIGICRPTLFFGFRRSDSIINDDQMQISKKCL